MKFALCNEVLAHLPFEEQCRAAAALGYAALELAPYTVFEDPARASDDDARAIARTAAAHGLSISGLHWLLVRPEGLSITSADRAVHARTVAFMRRLVALAAVMGARYLVHGSPKQRAPAPGQSLGDALARATEAFARAGDAARDAGVVYCVEPLSADQTPLVNTLEEAVALVRNAGSDGLRTMLDTSSAGLAESEPVPDLVRRWMPGGLGAHVQHNDPTRRAPGQGAMAFGPILAALEETGYAGEIAVEPFDYVPDGMGSAAYAIGYLNGLVQARRG
ncbi:MAG: sugar phosphate isomerase/epimerase family protein [Burkholderiaceae bacterium]